MLLHIKLPPFFFENLCQWSFMWKSLTRWSLILLHSERQKLFTILVFLRAIGWMVTLSVFSHNVTSRKWGIGVGFWFGSVSFFYQGLFMTVHTAVTSKILFHGILVRSYLPWNTDGNPSLSRNNSVFSSFVGFFSICLLSASNLFSAGLKNIKSYVLILEIQALFQMGNLLFCVYNFEIVI